MKIAVASYGKHQVAGHFGHCENFNFYRHRRRRHHLGSESCPQSRPPSRLPAQLPGRHGRGGHHRRRHGRRRCGDLQRARRRGHRRRSGRRPCRSGAYLRGELESPPAPSAMSTSTPESAESTTRSFYGRWAAMQPGCTAVFLPGGRFPPAHTILLIRSAPAPAASLPGQHQAPASGLSDGFPATVTLSRKSRTGPGILISNKGKELAVWQL